MCINKRLNLNRHPQRSSRLTRQRTRRHIISLPPIPRHKLHILPLVLLIPLHTLLPIPCPSDLPLALPTLAPQPPIPLPNLIPLPIQTPPCNPNVLPDILHQRILTHIIILRPYEPQNNQTKLRAVEIRFEVGEDVDLDAAGCVLVVRVVADAEDGGVHRGAGGGGDGGGVVEVADGVGGGFRGRGGVCGCAGDGGFVGGDRAVVERAEAVVDPRGEVGVAVYAEAREGDVGGGDAELGRVSGLCGVAELC